MVFYILNKNTSHQLLAWKWILTFMKIVIYLVMISLNFSSKISFSLNLWLLYFLFFFKFNRRCVVFLFYVSSKKFGLSLQFSPQGPSQATITVLSPEYGAELESLESVEDPIFRWFWWNWRDEDRLETLEGAWKAWNWANIW